MDKLLKIYTYVDGKNDTPFPNADAQIEIFSFNYNAKRMGGAPTISASVMYKDCLDDLWTGKEYVIHNGERYKLKQTPTSSKNNTDARYKHDLELVALRNVLDFVYFFDAVVGDVPVDDKPVTNSTKVTFSGDIHEFVKRLNASLQYTGLQIVESGKYVSGYKVVVDEGITSETKFLNFTDQPISSVLQEIYKQYEIPYYFDGETIHIGFTNNAITKRFKYGVDDALLSISKNNANNKIVNRCTGVGSSENIPYYYPNEHPLGIVDTYFTPNGGTKTLNNDLVTNKPLFAEKVKNNTVLTYKKVETENVIQDTKILYSDQFFEWYNTYVFTFDGLQSTIGGFASWYSMPDVLRKDVVDQFNVPKVEELGVYQNINLLTTPIYLNKNSDTACVRLLLNIDDSIDQNSVIKFSYEADKDRRLSVKYYIAPEKNNNYDVWSCEGIEINNETGVKVSDFKNTYKKTEQNIEEVPTRYIVYAVVKRAFSEEENESYAIKMGFTSIIEPAIVKHNWYNGNGSIVQLAEYGLTYSETPNVGDEITFQTRENSLIPFQDALMPPIYLESEGAESFYNAYNNTYISPETGTYYEFENEYSEDNRREHKEKFDYIKPSIEFVRNGDKLPINMFLAFAYDDNDSDEIDENGNYVHPYFYAKLRRFNGDNAFNLFDHASEQGEMTISMTSGNCGACKFVIGVDENTKKNIIQVDDNGDLVYENGKVKLGGAQDKQNDTRNNEVWIALKKDNQTFGKLYPNKSIRPKACSNASALDGDTFVITNINFPSAYLREAEQRLKEEIIKYMKLNNSEKFTFSIKFSRIFLAENPDVLSQLNENARIQIEYNEVPYELYISSYQYKVVANEALPEITVELADTLSTNENAIQKAISAVEHSIMSSVGSIDFYKQGLRYFLRKDVDDWARGVLHMIKGATFGANDIAKIDEQGNAELISQVIHQFITTPLFIDGFAGTGFKLWLDENGKANLTVDNLTARETFRVFELLVTKLRAVNGGLFVSAANGTIKEVNEGDEYYDITLENDNMFLKGDYMRCQVMSGVQMTSYWVEIESVNGKTCRVLKSEFNGSMPLVGQDVVLDGSKNIGRQNAIHISASDDKQPRIDILNNIKTKSHDGCLRVRLGNLDGIEDVDFGTGVVKGDGLYSDNVYLKGEFFLKNKGQSVETMFAVQDGKIQSSVSSIQEEAVKDKTLLYNASFTKGIEGWETSNSATLLKLGDKPLFLGEAVLAKSITIVNDPLFEDKCFLNINNGWIKQSYGTFVNIPDFDATKFYPLYFSVNVRCISAGTLTVKLLGLTGIVSTHDFAIGGVIYYTWQGSTYFCKVQSAISKGDRLVLAFNDKVLSAIYNATKNEIVPFKMVTATEGGSSSLREEITTIDVIILSKALTPTNNFVELNTNTMWKGGGDFYLEFSGEADIEGLILSTDKTEVKYATLFEQTDRVIQATAAMYGENDELLKKSGLVIKPEGAGLFTQDEKGNTATIGTYENGIIKLSGDKIQLEGNITANGKVKIDSKTGTLTADEATFTNGTFTGKITAESGKIAGFGIRGNYIEATTDNGFLSLSPKYLYYSDKETAADSTIQAFFGTNTTGGLINGATSVIRADISKEVTLGCNVGLWVDVTGANVEVTDYDASYGNHAILMKSGDIAGFRMRTRRISKDATLSNYDNVILLINTSEITITLPAEPKDAQFYMIKKCNGTTDVEATVTLKVGAEEHKILHQITGNNLAEVDSIGLTNRRYWRFLVWDSANKLWILGD